nr:hypothetical protein [Burkholderia cenocepacia]
MNDAFRAGRDAGADIARWTDPLIFAARHLGLAVSPEQVRGAASWASVAEPDAAVIEVAASAGLAAQFVALPPARLTPAMLPALAVFDDAHVGVIVSVAAGVRSSSSSSTASRSNARSIWTRRRRRGRPAC